MTYPPVDSAGLDPDIRLACAGDREAFGRIYARTCDIVYRFAYYRCRNPMLAEDITSATYLRALRHIETFVYQGKDIAAWFMTIARNLLADHYKSKRHQFEVLEIADDGPAAELWHTFVGVGHRCASAEEIVLADDTAAYIHDLIARLTTPGQRQVIELRFLRQLSVSETAAAMGLNTGAVKACQYRAVAALQRLHELDKAGWESSSQPA